MIEKYEYRKRPDEADEIEALKASGKPKIDMEYICDWFIGLWEAEKGIPKKPKGKAKPRRTKKRRISVEK